MGIERVEERRGFVEKTQSVLRRQKDDETVKMKGFKGFFKRFWKRKRQLKMTVDEATCRAIGKGVWWSVRKAEGTSVWNSVPAPRRSAVT